MDLTLRIRLPPLGLNESQYKAWEENQVLLNPRVQAVYKEMIQPTQTAFGRKAYMTFSSDGSFHGMSMEEKRKNDIIFSAISTLCELEYSTVTDDVILKELETRL